MKHSSEIPLEKREMLSRTGKGTPCGGWLRSFWLPAALSAEVCSNRPVAVTLLGEELILFRDGECRLVLVGRYCAHQGVDMMHGRIEPDGIRCMYHGWLFDQCGRVVIRGDWLPEKERRWDVGQPAYPCIETGGVVFAYMGKGERPSLPNFEFLSDSANVRRTRVLRETNYLAALPDRSERPHDAFKFILPSIVASQESPSGRDNMVRWYVPVDDGTHTVFTFRYSGGITAGGESTDGAAAILLRAVEIDSSISN